MRAVDPGTRIVDRAVAIPVRLPERRFEFVPLWGIAVFFVYTLRQVECPACGVKVEQVPWRDGKHQLTTSYRWFLASWAKRLSWQRVACAFGTSWQNVYRSVTHVVSWGLAHRNLEGIEAIGVDEIQWRREHKYLTLVYQIDEDCRRLLWIGADRTAKTLLGFLCLLGRERSGRMRREEFLRAYLPPEDRRMKLSPAKALLVLLRNLLLAREPIYGVGEWAARHAPDLLGLTKQELALLNDDRVGRALDRLFAADMPSLVLAVATHVVREFGVRWDELHNDSTTASFCGAYTRAARDASWDGPPWRSPSVTTRTIVPTCNSCCSSSRSPPMAACRCTSAPKAAT